MGQDIRVAIRRLWATPQFCIFAVLSLSIGIGVTTAAYSILYSLIWKPVTVANPSRVVFIANPAIGQASPLRASVSKPDFEDLRRSVHSLEPIAASAFFYQTLVTPDSSEALEGEAVSGDYFRAAGVPVVLGRAIQPADDETAREVIVLSHRVWRTRFDSDRAIVGRAVRLGGHSFDVIGVAPEWFEGIARIPQRADGWIPLRALPAIGEKGLESRDRRMLAVFGRLAAGWNRNSASSEISAIGRQLDAELPFRRSTSNNGPPLVLPRNWAARAATDVGNADSGIAALVLGLVALVLIVACTNLANLMLARGAAREREIAVRRALGAPRWRLVRELLLESTIVAGFGGALSLIIIRILLAIATVDIPMPGRMFSLRPQLDLSAIVGSSVALMVALLVFGLVSNPSATDSRGDETIYSVHRCWHRGR
jgi:predicted permease